jgi:hypothetical protein
VCSWPPRCRSPGGGAAHVAGPGPWRSSTACTVLIAGQRRGTTASAPGRVPERAAMQLTGHKARSVFERYNIVSEGDLTDAARKLTVFGSAKTSASSS